MLIKTLHIALIFSLLTSSVGVVINQHFCQDKLKSTALFTAVQTCHSAKEADQPACPHHQKQDQKTGLAKKDCCNDNSQFFKSSQEQQMEQLNLPIWNSLAVTPAFSISMISLIRQSAQLSDRFYRPPPLQTEPSIQFQIFRL